MINSVGEYWPIFPSQSRLSLSSRWYFRTVCQNPYNKLTKTVFLSNFTWIVLPFVFRFGNIGTACGRRGAASELVGLLVCVEIHQFKQCETSKPVLSPVETYTIVVTHRTWLSKCQADCDMYACISLLVLIKRWANVIQRLRQSNGLFVWLNRSELNVAYDKHCAGVMSAQLSDLADSVAAECKLLVAHALLLSTTPRTRAIDGLSCFRH